MPLRNDYFEEDITVDLPEGVTIRDIDFISVYDIKYHRQLSTALINELVTDLPAYIPPVLVSWTIILEFFRIFKNQDLNMISMCHVE